MEEKELKEKARYYAGLPYTIAVEKCDDQGTYYIAKYIELPHFIMTGSTPEEAVRELESEKLEWFELNLENGNPIPLPIKSRKHSGKVALRMAPGLHEHLIKCSELEGVSLNNYMVRELARNSGYNGEPKTRVTRSAKARSGQKG